MTASSSGGLSHTGILGCAKAVTTACCLAAAPRTDFMFYGRCIASTLKASISRLADVFTSSPACLRQYVAVLLFEQGQQQPAATTSCW